MGDTNNEEEATKYTTDDVIEQIKKAGSCGRRAAGFVN